MPALTNRNSHQFDGNGFWSKNRDDVGYNQLHKVELDPIFIYLFIILLVPWFFVCFVNHLGRCWITVFGLVVTCGVNNNELFDLVLDLLVETIRVMIFSFFLGLELGCVIIITVRWNCSPFWFVFLCFDEWKLGLILYSHYCVWWRYIKWNWCYFWISDISSGVIF